MRADAHRLLLLLREGLRPGRLGHQHRVRAHASDKANARSSNAPGHEDDWKEMGRIVSYLSSAPGGVQTSHPKFEFASSADVQSKTFVNENTIFRVSFLIITTLEIHLQKDMITH